MKTQDYQAMLRAVDQALDVCDRSTGFMDEVHRKICQDLRETRARLIQLLGTSSNPGLTKANASRAIQPPTDSVRSIFCSTEFRICQDP